jgi:hypothetical protein
MAKTRMVQGTGESKLNRDPDAPSIYAALKGRHVGGVPIEELPEILVAKLSIQHTDEDIAERNAGRAEPSGIQVGHSGARAPMTAREFGRSVEERRDFRQDATTDIFEAPDPMKEIIEKHVPLGMSAKFLSPGKIEQEGLRGFEVVKDSKGDPVKLGRMVLGVMPKPKAKARNTFYRNKGTATLAKIEEDFRERQRELSED